MTTYIYEYNKNAPINMTKYLSQSETLMKNTKYKTIIIIIITIF